jgi:putative phosphotransacetylase
VKSLNTNDLVATITETILNQYSQSKKVPVGISNRHVHLSKMDLDTLFGQGFQLSVMKELSQPGQYASEQKVILVGPGGVIENVRILGPVRDKTQVEVSLSDCFKLGIKAPIRDSGDLEGSSGITLVGPKGSVTINEGTIIAARHIHMHTEDAKKFGVVDKERVCVKVPGARGLVFGEVLVRVSEKYQLEMHVDLDEANAAGLKNQDLLEIV